MNQHRPTRRHLLSVATAACVAGTLGTATATATGRSSPRQDPDLVQALARGARPLAELSALGRMVGGARVVGLGEASHSAHEFLTLKHRVFRYLVETKGFTTFALEASWSTGLLLDAYVTRGVGDPAQIMRDEFQGQYVFWNTEEYLDLIHWMRRRNTSRPDRPRLRFLGNDLGFPGAEAFDRVTAYVTARRPDLAGRVAGLYEGLRPAPGADSGSWMREHLTQDASLSRSQAERANAVVALLRDEGSPAGPSRGSSARSYAEALRNATAVAQCFTGYAFPATEFAERMRYRDQVMADNTAWWLGHHGGRILLASNNGHVAYTSDNPDEFPVPTGAFLRERLGGAYVSIGTTFHEGTVNALPDFTSGTPRAYTVAPAPAGHNEHVLDQVGHQDFVLDLRSAPTLVRAWLTTARPTRSYGLYWSPEDPHTALATSYDVLIHLREVTAGRLL